MDQVQSFLNQMEKEQPLFGEGCSDQEINLVSSMLVANELAKLRKTIQEESTSIQHSLDKIAECAGQPRGS